MPRFPRTISFSRLSEMPRRFAASSCPRPSGFRYSSSRISPGGIAGPSHSGFLVIVFDADFVGMSVLPPEGHPVLLVDANAVSARLIALQQFQPVSCRNSEIFQSTGRVEQHQLALRAAPQFAGNAARGSCIAFTKQIR